MESETSRVRGLPGGLAVKNPPASAGDRGSIPGPGRSHTLLSNEARGPHHWACALESRSHPYRAHMPRSCALQQEKPAQ